MSGTGVDDDRYPLPIEANWKNFGGREALAAVRWDSGNIYAFLEGGYYSRIEPNGKSSEGYPVKITDQNWKGLAPYGEDIKAAVNWGDGIIYFFLEDDDHVRWDISARSGTKGTTSRIWTGVSDDEDVMVAFRFY